MGVFSFLKRLVRGERDVRFLVLGLDNAGKTSILNMLGEDIHSGSVQASTSSENKFSRRASMIFSPAPLAPSYVDSGFGPTVAQDDSSPRVGPSATSPKSISSFSVSSMSPDSLTATTHDPKISSRREEQMQRRRQRMSMVDTAPTVGSVTRSIGSLHGLRISACDLGGQRRMRTMWRAQYPNTDLLIFVIDSSDRERAVEARVEFLVLLKEKALVGIPILVFANKQDISGCLDAHTVLEMLELHKINDRQWHLQPCSTRTGAGLQQGLEWACSMAQRPHS